jgi:hypothetical protein
LTRTLHNVSRETFQPLNVEKNRETLMKIVILGRETFQNKVKKAEKHNRTKENKNNDEH